MSTFSSKGQKTAIITPKRTAKRIVLAGRFPFAMKVAELFRKLGWEVHTVTTEDDVHAAVAETIPHAIVLPEDAGDESGYLACAKIRQTRPELKLVVIGIEHSETRARFAEFVGAEYLTEADGAQTIINAVV